MASSTFQSDLPSAIHMTSQNQQNLPELMYHLSCLTELCELGFALASEENPQAWRQQLLELICRSLTLTEACILCYHAPLQRFLISAVYGNLPCQAIAASIDENPPALLTHQGPGEMLTMRAIDGRPMILVTLSLNGRLQGILALGASDHFLSGHERVLLLAALGKTLALLLYMQECVILTRQETIEQERNRIAQLLHDTVAHYITHALHQLDYLVQHPINKKVSSVPLPTRLNLFAKSVQGRLWIARLLEIRQTLFEGLLATRVSIDILLACTKDEVPVTQLIRSLVEQQRGLYPHIAFGYEQNFKNDDITLSTRHKEVVLYIVRESVANALQHAQPTRIDVSFTLHTYELHVCIRDNGQGFESASLSQSCYQHDERFGLHSMSEQVCLVGGEWKIQSQPGHGTSVEVIFPLASAPCLLTRREREILLLVSEGLTNREIGLRLAISNETVKTHLHHIMQKLRASDRRQAALIALRHGWLATEQEGGL